MNYEIKLTVGVVADCTLAEAVKRVQDAIDADKARACAWVISIDKAIRAKDQ